MKNNIDSDQKDISPVISRSEAMRNLYSFGTLDNILGISNERNE